MITIVEDKYVQVESGSSRYVEILCKSSDTKPTENIAAGSLAEELDTKDMYYFNGTAWAKVGA